MIKRILVLLLMLHLCLLVAPSTRTGIEILNPGLIDLQKQSESDFVDSQFGKTFLTHYTYCMFNVTDDNHIILCRPAVLKLYRKCR